MTLTVPKKDEKEEEKNGQENLKEETQGLTEKDKEGRETTFDGIRRRKNQFQSFFLNLVLNIRFQYVILGLCGVMALCYTVGAVIESFMKEWVFQDLYRFGLIYMLLIAGCMWGNLKAKWFLLAFHIGRPRSSERWWRVLGCLLILGYILVTGLLLISYGAAILLPLIKYDNPTYTNFNTPIYFVLPLCFQVVLELLFWYYWICKDRLCRHTIQFVLNPYF